MFDLLKTFLSEYKNIDKDTVTMQSSLTLDLGLTSYDIVEVCAYMEDILQVEISDEILPGLSSVGDLVLHIESLKNAGDCDVLNPEYSLAGDVK